MSPKSSDKYPCKRHREDTLRTGQSEDGLEREVATSQGMTPRDGRGKGGGSPVAPPEGVQT